MIFTGLTGKKILANFSCSQMIIYLGHFLAPHDRTPVFVPVLFKMICGNNAQSAASSRNPVVDTRTSFAYTDTTIIRKNEVDHAIIGRLIQAYTQVFC